MKHVEKKAIDKNSVDKKAIDYKAVDKPKGEKSSKLFWIVILDINILLLICLLGFFFILKPKIDASHNQVKDLANKVVKDTDHVPDTKASDTITYQGKTYRYNDQLTTILFLGVDQTDIKAVENKDTSVSGGGQSDVDVLFVLDQSKKTGKVIAIDRNTMTQILTYDKEGKQTDSDSRQLCLAYSYAGGGSKGAKATSYAISQMLKGIPIQHYLATDFTGIQIANDSLGGVTIDALEDIDSWHTGDQITLHGADAERYIRYRDLTGSGGNVKRMAREKQFFESFLKQLHQKMKQDLTIPLSMFQMMSDHMVTDLSGSEFSDLMENFSGQEISDMNYISLPGETRYNASTDHDEFYLDQDKLYELIVQTFYVPVDGE